MFLLKEVDINADIQQNLLSLDYISQITTAQIMKHVKLVNKHNKETFITWYTKGSNNIVVIPNKSTHFGYSNKDVAVLWDELMEDHQLSGHKVAFNIEDIFLKRSGPVVSLLKAVPA